MESKTNYAIVGFIVLILITSLIASSVWLSVGFDRKRYDVYAVYMHEAVSGLSLDAPVKFNGVKVGYVHQIRLNQNNPQEVELLLNIYHDIPITTSTSATLISQGITGTTYVGLAASSPDLTLLQRQPTEEYPVIPSRPSLFNQLDNALKGVSENINAVSIEVKRVFNEENAANLKETLIGLRAFTTELAKDTSAIHNIVEHLATSSQKWPQITTQISSGTASFSQETLPALNTLLKHLNHVAVHLESTSRELSHNPSALVRGTASPAKGPGE